MTIDQESDAGAWEREWDRQSHTVSEYQREIRELRLRIKDYVSRITELEIALHEEQSRNNEWIREP